MKGVIEKKETKLRHSQQLALAARSPETHLARQKWAVEAQIAGLSAPNLEEQEYTERSAE